MRGTAKTTAEMNRFLNSFTMKFFERLVYLGLARDLVRNGVISTLRKYSFLPKLSVALSKKLHGREVKRVSVNTRP